MARILFGNSEFADAAFHVPLLMWQVSQFVPPTVAPHSDPIIDTQTMLNEITSKDQPGKTLKVVLWANRYPIFLQRTMTVVDRLFHRPLLRWSNEIDLFVEPVEFDHGWFEPSISVSSGDLGMINARTDNESYIAKLMQQATSTNNNDSESYGLHELNASFGINQHSLQLTVLDFSSQTGEN